MKITADNVRHVATLAELEVAETQVERLATELAAIVTFVEQLNALEASSDSSSPVIGPESLRLRADVVAPIPLAHPPASFAPAMRDGLFVVPRLDGLVDE